VFGLIVFSFILKHPDLAARIRRAISATSPTHGLSGQSKQCLQAFPILLVLLVSDLFLNKLEIHEYK
jgi:hypothetical protein